MKKIIIVIIVAIIAYAVYTNTRPPHPAYQYCELYCDGKILQTQQAIEVIGLDVSGWWRTLEEEEVADDGNSVTFTVLQSLDKMSQGGGSVITGHDRYIVTLEKKRGTWVITETEEIDKVETTGLAHKLSELRFYNVELPDGNRY